MLTFSKMSESSNYQSLNPDASHKWSDYYDAVANLPSRDTLLTEEG